MQTSHDTSEALVDEEEIDNLPSLWAGEGLANDAVIARHTDATKAALDRVAATLARIETLITLTDRVLRISQPPRPGKIGVRWWITSGSTDLRYPVLVTWRRMTNGRWRCKKLAQVRRDRISKEGTSAMNHEETYYLALTASRLIKAYGMLFGTLRTQASVLNRSHAKWFAKLEEHESVIRVTHTRVTTKLLKAGYEVDRDAMRLLETAGL